MGRPRSLATVAVERDGRRILINRKDYNPDVDELWEDAASEPADVSDLPSEETPITKESKVEKTKGLKVKRVKK